MVGINRRADTNFQDIIINLIEIHEVTQGTWRESSNYLVGYTKVISAEIWVINYFHAETRKHSPIKDSEPRR